MPSRLTSLQRSTQEIFYLGVRFLGLYATIPLIFNILFLETADTSTSPIIEKITLQGLAKLNQHIGANTLSLLGCCGFLWQTPGAIRQTTRTLTYFSNLHRSSIPTIASPDLTSKAFAQSPPKLR